jgi:hypothetical protein
MVAAAVAEVAAAAAEVAATAAVVEVPTHLPTKPNKPATQREGLRLEKTPSGSALIPRSRRHVWRGGTPQYMTLACSGKNCQQMRASAIGRDRI